MKRIQQFFFVFLVSVFSLSAHAQFYLGATAGNVSVDSDLDLKSAFGLKFGGGYKFSDNFAIELSYVDLGEHDLTSAGIDSLEQEFDLGLPGIEVSLDAASVDISGIDVSLVGIIPINDQFEIFGRVGNFSWDTDINVSVTVTDGFTTERGSDTQSVDDNDLSFGAGVAYYVTEKFALTAEFHRFEAGESDNDLLGVGMTYTF